MNSVILVDRAAADKECFHRSTGSVPPETTLERVETDFEQRLEAERDEDGGGEGQQASIVDASGLA